MPLRGQVYLGEGFCANGAQIITMAWGRRFGEQDCR